MANAKSAAVSAETIENLKAAYNGERNATARYIAFAVQADKEGFLGVGSLFRAIAHSEQIHATNHARVLRKLGGDLDLNVQPLEVRTTSDNLRTALRGEQDEVDQMYPQFSEQARKDGCQDAVETFDSASDAESVHALMFAAAMESLEDYSERATYYVCMMCGWVSTGPNFVRCVLCNNPKDRFDKVE